MFIVVEMTDVVTISPTEFDEDYEKIFKMKLYRRYANKVVHDVGLCICLYDILECGEGHLYPEDGASYFKVKFRFVVFRPMVDEILVGKIKSSSSEGILVTLGFFDDILIRPECMPQHTLFNDQEQVWIWNYKMPFFLSVVFSY